MACFTLCINVIHACAQYTVSGHLTDSLTGEPIGNASIRVGANAVFSHTSVTAATAVSDQEGNFSLSVLPEKTTLLITSAGYHPKLYQLNRTALRQQIRLCPAVINLQELTISQPLNANIFQTLSRLDLNLKPVNSSQDLMRLVPGLFIAQHMGGGKAEQIFIRGFDADHGTDLNITVDGLPVNLVSHIHGQGYADLHFLIPETITTYEFGKGPYYVDHGDFTTAGYLSYTTKTAPERNLLSIEGGQFKGRRIAALINILGSAARNRGINAYLAGEYNFTDGPFLLAEHYKRVNLFGKVSLPVSAQTRLTLIASTFTTSWHASGELPERVASRSSTAAYSNGQPYTIETHTPLLNHFGTIDSTQGGSSSRMNLIVSTRSELPNNFRIEQELFFSHYTFLLHVNSTFFARDSVNGDERQQYESRNLLGYRAGVNKQYYLGNRSFLTHLGLESRFDQTRGSAYTLVNRHYLLLHTVSRGNIRQNNSALFIEENGQAGKWIFSLGTRVDYFNFCYHDSTKVHAIVSPKLNIRFTADSSWQFYLKLGKGFHSNNAIAVVGNNALQTLPAAYGADLGMNFKPAPGFYLNAAIWYLHMAQEFIYTDDGDIAPGGKTRRLGLDLSIRYQLYTWLFFDANINLARSRLTDSARNRGYLALAPLLTSSGGIIFRFKSGLNGGISYRYMHSRPGNNTNTLSASGYLVTDLKLNYTYRRYELGIAAENLLNTRWHEFEGEEISRLKNERAAIDQMSFTAGTPLSLKLRMAVFF